MQAELPSVPQENPAVFNSIVELFKSRGVKDFRIVDHGICKTSQESAAVRKTPLGIGAKTMIISKKKQASTEPELIMLIYPADRKLSWAKVKQVEGIGKRFDRADESLVETITGIKQGGVPPFPSLLKMKGYMHTDTLTANQQIAFNAGMRTRSIIMKASDLPTDSIEFCDLCQTST